MDLQVWKGPVSADWNWLVTTDAVTFTPESVRLQSDTDPSTCMLCERERDEPSSGSKNSLLPFPASWLQQLASLWNPTPREDWDVFLLEFLQRWRRLPPSCGGVTLKLMWSRALGPSRTHSGLFWQHPGGAEPSIKKKMGPYHSDGAAGEDGRLIQKSLETSSQIQTGLNWLNLPDAGSFSVVCLSESFA